ncbi:hypothetical protein [Romboutsia lituseburensis]|uniref:hypothetical protein n=1 Tax=Romboutsia lituseburensis TaxID=1537 RepID=UPI00215ADF90|nr:hypothetical protein [Romboutsia lituseburensis]MCR8744367.1 hypothetical protein [Romboutsia lituseburensis]
MENLKVLQAQNLLEGTWYFPKEDVFIRSKIVDVEILKNCFGEEDLMDIKLENGHIAICEYSEVIKIPRPSNIVSAFDWCFAIQNKDKEFIGYIGKPRA